MYVFGSNISKKVKGVQKYRDVLKYMTAMREMEASYIIFGMENQTDIHYAMLVKIWSMMHCSMLDRYQKYLLFIWKNRDMKQWAVLSFSPDSREEISCSQWLLWWYILEQPHRTALCLCMKCFLCGMIQYWDMHRITGYICWIPAEYPRMTSKSLHQACGKC